MEAGKKNCSKTRALVDSFKAEVEREIALAEKKTSLEFVAVVSEGSSRYRTWFWMCLVTPVLIEILVGTFYGDRLTENWNIGLSAVLAVWMIGVFFLDWHRFLVPKREMREKVETKARLAFLKNEVFATKKRTGILIYLSLLEKSVYIMADRGFEGKVDSAEWSKLALKLAHDFNQNNPGRTFTEGLKELVERLAPEFPPIEGDSNELDDAIRLN